MKKELVQLFVSCALAVCAIGCATSPNNSPSRPKHVVFIGFDGMGGAYLDDTLKLPNMRRMMKEGAWTLHNRSILPSSSAANWASIFMAAGDEQHGYNAWNSSNSAFRPLFTMPSGRFPDVYACCRDQHPSAKLGLVYEWTGIAHVLDTNACDFVRRTNQCAEVGIPYLVSEKPQLLSLVYDMPDHEGHSKGWGSPEYRAALERADVIIGQVLKALEDAGMLDDTVVIVGSDHGGVNRGHGGATVEQMDKPLIFWGKGVRKDHEIWNATFSYDLGATMAWLLDVEMPQICIGRPITEAFE